MDQDEINEMINQAGVNPNIIGQNQPEKLDNISLFLQHVDPDDLMNIILDKTRSIGIIREEHNLAYYMADQCILKHLGHGQIYSAVNMAKLIEAEFRRSMSNEGHFIDNVSKQELRYTTTQHLYPHEQEQAKKKGFWRRGK